VHPNAQIVFEFVRGWNDRNRDRVTSFPAPRAFYYDIPMQPLEGAAAIRAGLERLAPTTAVDWKVHDWAVSDPGCVLTERMDRF